MGKHETPPRGGRVVNPSAGNVTALPPSKPSVLAIARNSRRFSKLVEECDQLVEEERRLHRKLGELSDRKRGAPVPDLAEAEMDHDTKAMLTRCRERIKQFDREDFYEFDEEDEEKILKLETIVDRLTETYMCVDSGPTDTKPEGFVLKLAMKVYDHRKMNISFLALESACREIEEGKKPLKFIGPLLDILEEHEKQWRRRRRTLNFIGYRIGDLRKAILEEQSKYERELAVIAVYDAERALQDAQAKVQRLCNDQKATVDTRNDLKRQYEEAGEDLERIVEAREAAERELPDLELALQSAQAALAKLGSASKAGDDQKPKLIAFNAAPDEGLPDDELFK